MSGCFNAAGDTIAMAGVSIGGGIGLRDPKIRTRERLKGRGNRVKYKRYPGGAGVGRLVCKAFNTVAGNEQAQGPRVGKK